MKIEIHNCDRCNQIIFIIDNDGVKKEIVPHGQVYVEGAVVQWGTEVRRWSYPSSSPDKTSKHYTEIERHHIIKSWCLSCIVPLQKLFAEMQAYVADAPIQERSIADSIVAAIQQPAQLRLK